MKNLPICYQLRVSENIISGEKLLSEVLHLIKYGSTETDELILKARKFGKGSMEYDEIKKNQLPAFLFNFRFNKKVSNKSITEATGLLYLDIDGIESVEDLNRIKSTIQKLPFVYAYWKSLSEKGLSILVSVDGMNADNFRLFKLYFQHKLKAHDALLNFDDNAWKQTQKNVLSKDENLYTNEQVEPLTYTVIREYCVRNDLIDEEKVQSDLLKKRKESIDSQIAPFEVSSLPTNSIQLSDKYKYVDSNKLYTVHPSGVPVNEIHLHKKRKLKEGDRSKTLHVLACKFIRINGADSNNVFAFLKSVRDTHCESPKTLTDNELRKIVRSAMSNYSNENIKTIQRYIIFRPNSQMTPGERIKIACVEMGKIKTDRTISLLQKHYMPGMTQKQLATLSGKSIRTVKDYWNKDADGNVFFARPIRTIKRTIRGRHCSRNKNRSG